MDGNTNAAELVRLINKLLNRMDERQLRAMYAHANRVFCAGGSNEPLQRTYRPQSGKRERNGRSDGKGAQIEN